jgi:hypothetical protein
MKKLAQAALIAATLAAIAPGLAQARPWHHHHHYRHRVCTWRHHHRVCFWR